MARAGLVPSPREEVTQLTNADVSGALTWQHTGGSDALLIGTTDDTEPSIEDFDAGLKVVRGDGLIDTSLAEMFPGASYVRLWSYSKDGCQFAVYHA
ncbi:MAG: hypothetical protein RIA08_09680 [Roseovarius sp.]|uniref:hypothetical protein n=1 Tax=Roseovarius sp. TaxID=1486281 RepID=UPI0032EAB11C